MNIVGCVHTCITTLCIQVEARQKLLEAKDKEEEEDKKAQIDEDAPIHACHEKAIFLLKFSGLSKVARDEKQPPSSPTLRPSWVQKSKRWQKVSTAVSTVGKLKQHVSGFTAEPEHICTQAVGMLK